MQRQQKIIFGALKVAAKLSLKGQPPKTPPESMLRAGSCSPAGVTGLERFWRALEVCGGLE